ncbi:MAG: Gfo/Idh/MocA family oxidoreductase [Lachnospiraceae bacterium]|nr:Gfo/Idh/MocA family oxidoreductase [Lachnospiraceae bacterium]
MEGLRFNVAIMGAGHIAESMSDALKGIREEVNMYAVASRDLDKAKIFAGTHGFQRYYGSYEELASDDNVDLIYIATPHSEHYANAKLCIEHGRNCLVEKAFCANRKQAEEIISLAREKKVFLAEAMWTRYMPSALIIRDILRNGRLGQINYLECDFSVPISGKQRLTSPALAGGALLDLGVYSLTVPAMYLGSDVAQVRTTCEKHDTGVDATDEVTLIYGNGTMAKCKCSFVNTWSNYAKIVCEKGYLEFGPINVPEYVEVHDIDGRLTEKIILEKRVNGYEYEVLAAKKSIRDGIFEAPAMPWSETLRIMGWMDSLRNHWGVHFPFEAPEDIAIDDVKAWGNADVFDDVNPWDRSRTISFLETYDIETGQTETLASFDKVIEAPNWSHDGRFLVYNCDGRVYKFDLKTKSYERIDSGSLDKINNDHVLSSDDKEIAVSDESVFDGRSRIYRIPLDGGEPMLVTPFAPSYLHGWSPDRKKMCYCAERNGEYDVYSISPNGGQESRLTTAPGLNDGCEYDNTGKYIYFNSVRTGLMQAWRMNADGTNQVQLTFDRDLNTWFPHISPDGEHIVMISYRRGDLWPGDHVPNKIVEVRMMDSDGSNIHTLFKVFGGQGTMNVNSWSPDSKKFAFVRYKRK